MDNSLQWQLARFEATSNRQLEDIKCHLCMICMALEAIADFSSEAVDRAAKDLNVESVWWQLECSNSIKRTSQSRKKLTLEQMRASIAIICYFAHRHQELLRRAVSLLEEAVRQNKSPQQTTLLSNYLERFINYYLKRITKDSNLSTESLSYLAWKLLNDLLFYSGKNGYHLLWNAIFDNV
jgi:tRNA U34 5-carboxymethylaminomethyl modifying GTPase MnmE/TrmE